MRVMGYGEYQYYPRLASVGGGGEWALAAVMLLLLAAIMPLAWLKRRVELD
jgi:hypothetical protein